MNDETRKAFEKWYIARQRAKGFGARLSDEEFVAKHPDGRYRSGWLDFAFEAYCEGMMEHYRSMCA